jgi:class 3 adenylate cyclase
MGETRKLAAILVSDVVGYSRLAGADEDRILARLRTLRSDLIDPTVSVHRGRVVKRTGDVARLCASYQYRMFGDPAACFNFQQASLMKGLCDPLSDTREIFLKQKCR